MSFNARNWARTVALSSGRDRAVLNCLADFFNDAKGYAFPSVATLAKTLSMTVRTTQRGLRALESAGVISCAPVYGDGGRVGTRFTFLGYDPKKDYRHAPTAELIPKKRGAKAKADRPTGGTPSASVGDTLSPVGDTLKNPVGDNLPKSVGDTLTPSEGDKFTPSDWFKNWSVSHVREGKETRLDKSDLYGVFNLTSPENVKTAQWVTPSGRWVTKTPSVGDKNAVGGCQFVTLTIKELLINYKKERTKVLSKKDEGESFDLVEAVSKNLSDWIAKADEVGTAEELTALQAWDDINAREKPATGWSVPPSQIKDAYNAHPVADRLGRALKLSKPRASAIEARTADAVSLFKLKTPAEVLDWFESYFDRVNSAPWLVGDNPEGWKASFDWIFKPQNFIKVCEGRYDVDKSKVTKQGKGYREPEREWTADYYLQGAEAFHSA